MRSFLAAIAALLLQCGAAAQVIDAAPAQPKPMLEDTGDTSMPDQPETPPPAGETPPANADPLHLRNPHPTSTIKHTATSMAICLDAESKNCKEYLMPPEVGNVQRFIHGTFVSYEVAHASWLALTVKHASMCYLAKADDSDLCSSRCYCS